MELQLDIDEALMASVKKLTEIDDPQQAILDAVKRYVRLEAGRRLIAMGGSDPTAEAAPRRRFSREAPGMSRDLAEALEWAAKTPPKATDLSTLKVSKRKK